MATLKNTTVSETGAAQLPVGTTAQRPGSPVTGDTRFNEDFKRVEYYDGSIWRYMPDIVRSGLVLNLDAAEPSSYPGTGTTWSDLSGNSNDGTLVNGVGYDSDNGGSLVFDGTNDIVNTSYSPPNVYTFSAWFKTDVVSNGYRNIMSVPFPSYALILLDDNTSFLGFWTSDSLTSGSTLSTPTIQINTWYNVVFVREGNSITGGYKAYLNSISYGSANTGNWSTSGNFSIGGRTDQTQFLNGNVSQVSIYNRALSGAEIKQNFNALRGRYGI